MLGSLGPFFYQLSCLMILCLNARMHHRALLSRCSKRARLNSSPW